MTRRWLAPLLALLMLVATALAWERVPERIPTHWNAAGEPDAFGSRLTLLVLPISAFALWLTFVVLARAGPRRENVERVQETWWLIANVALLLLAALHGSILAVSLGAAFDVTRFALLVTGLGLAVIGNYLPRLRPNWWMGIRTPWTLESDEVWRETHRVGGRLMLVAGLVGAGAAFLPPPANGLVFVGAVLAAAAGSVAYSYLVWRRLGH